MKFGNVLIKRITVEIIREINKKVGFRLVTKFGQTGVINLSKYVSVILVCFIDKILRKLKNNYIILL
ncbi:hypothetical protein [Intestinibacter bartlettii]|jgi:hypothetical protein|uniref:hypothetical protein n=1 Tax=Intestinibacter bartlettii TaxID=261299 RepID=UPI0006C0748D|nr:hypothetical protein [Intestinibacter bartlettii]CUO75661.1 Uncharacterised protein [Intestinibacter bartlettii]